MQTSLRSFLLTGLLVATCTPAAAQNPTAAQRDAIRSACRSDFLAHCASVQPGGKEALACLLQNDTRLSESCKSAVSAVSSQPRPAPKEPAATPASAAASPSKPAAAQPQEDQLRVVRRACTLDDFMAHCSWIQPSNPELVLCLKANAAGLSPSCQAAVASLSNSMRPQSLDTAPKEQSAPSPKKAASAKAVPQIPPQAPAARQPTQGQKNAVRQACRADFMSHCSGVQPGGAKAVNCLQRHAGELSAPCRTALAAIPERESASSTATPVENTPPAAVVAPVSVPDLPPRRALAILRVCREEARLLCDNIPAGGGRVIACLAENASRLSPVCYRALAAVRAD